MDMGFLLNCKKDRMSTGNSSLTELILSVTHIVGFLHSYYVSVIQLLLVGTRSQSMDAFPYLEVHGT